MKKIRTHNDLIISKVKNSNPREIYAGLLWWQRQNGFRPGWVFNKFLEIYEKKPRPLNPVEPQFPGSELREYLSIMKNRWKQRKRREELKQGAGNVSN